MKQPNRTILVVDDERDICKEIKEFLQGNHLQVKTAETPSEAFRILLKYPVDITILDICLPEMSGLEVLKQIRHYNLSTEVIVMSGHGDMDAVITALRLGAIDFFKKPFHFSEMMETIEKAIRLRSIRGQMNVATIENPVEGAPGRNQLHPIIATCPSMKAVVNKMRLVARSRDTTVLITGESGTGKELIARGIHAMSCRENMPFYPVNCSSIPDELFESEFFGYKKGAFTGAVNDKGGWFEAADRGTLFLDEIGDLKYHQQSKLLRVLDDKMICRLGSSVLHKVDIRIIAATNQDLEALVQQKLFRSDLFHRLNTFVLHVPPLRERIEGIPILFDTYLAYYAFKLEIPVPEVDPAITDSLLKYDFPGNVRELMHMIERALILCDGGKLTIDHFDHLELKLKGSSVPVSRPQPAQKLYETDKESIESALRDAGYNKSQAARLLGLSRQALDRRIVKLGIALPDHCPPKNPAEQVSA
jgi:DNA-binding NtrC family response regulator